MNVRAVLPWLLAAGGAVIAILGNVFFSVGPHGETGVLAGKGGILFWWMALPGGFLGVFFETVGIAYPWNSVLGGALLWGLVGVFIALLFRRRHSTSS